MQILKNVDYTTAHDVKTVRNDHSEPLFNAKSALALAGVAALVSVAVYSILSSMNMCAAPSKPSIPPVLHLRILPHQLSPILHFHLRI